MCPASPAKEDPAVAQGLGNPAAGAEDGRPLERADESAARRPLVHDTLEQFARRCVFGGPAGDADSQAELAVAEGCEAESAAAGVAVEQLVGVQVTVDRSVADGEQHVLAAAEELDAG